MPINAAQSARCKSDIAKKESQKTMMVLSSHVEQKGGHENTLTTNDFLKED
ncbi:MAG: hypothetical protein ACR5K7_02930 [Symbiopectobacterium sp.]